MLGQCHSRQKVPRYQHHVHPCVDMRSAATLASCLLSWQEAAATSKGSRPKAKGTGNTQRLLAEGNRHYKPTKAKAIGTSTGKGTSKGTGTNNARAEATVKAKAEAQADTAQSQSDWIGAYLSPGQDVTLKHWSILTWLLVQHWCFILTTAGGGEQLCGTASWSLHDVLQ